MHTLVNSDLILAGCQNVTYRAPPPIFFGSATYKKTVLFLPSLHKKSGGAKKGVGCRCLPLLLFILLIFFLYFLEETKKNVGAPPTPFLVPPLSYKERNKEKCI